MTGNRVNSVPNKTTTALRPRRSRPKGFDGLLRGLRELTPPCRTCENAFIMKTVGAGNELNPPGRWDIVISGQYHSRYP
jgi:hypothetical protein